MSTEEKAIALVKEATVRLRSNTVSKFGIVRVKDFRCLASCGGDGIWRDANKRPLAVLGVVTELWNH
jgi:hypothetical protein